MQMKRISWPRIPAIRTLLGPDWPGPEDPEAGQPFSASDMAAWNGRDDEDDGDDPDTDTSAPEHVAITHERAAALLRDGAPERLSPADANALAAHLMTCDACFRLAQDEAAARRSR